MTPAEAHLERTIVEALVASAWIEGAPDRVVPERALLPEDLFAWLRDAHPAQWARLAKAHGESLPERLVSALDDALRTSNTPAVLREGFSFDGETIELVCFPPAHGLNPEAVARAAKNRLVVTRQAPIEPGTHKTVDLMLSLNGVPIATVELKHRPNAQTAADARAQYMARPTHLPIFRWPSRAVVHFAVDDYEAWMTTRVDGPRTVFVPFNQGTVDGAGNPPNSHGYSTDYLWRDVWTRDSMLSLLERYVHLLEVSVDRGGRMVVEKRMLFPRWHQRDAVRALMADVETRGPGQRYLIEHSAGSGKSNTIAWLAWRLADLHDLEGPLFDKVVVVTDRTVLDNQLAQTIEQMTSRKSRVVQVREQVRASRRAARTSALDDGAVTGGGALVDAIDDPSVRVVIVTVQTFLHAAESLDQRARRSFAVLLDEAHAGVGESSDKAMSRVLHDGDEAGDDYLMVYARQRQHPNQSLFAFTATPRAETLFLYGQEVPGSTERVAFHRYTMQQAIAEGFIVDVRDGYIRYEAYFKLRGVGVDDPEVDQKTATAAVMREVSKDPKVVETKCRVIARHFLTKVRGELGGEARAMVVAPSRDAAVRYARVLRQALDARGGHAVGVLVAFSGSVKDPDTGDDVTEAELNGFSERELPRRFASGADRILVVANKYQTGFDQPLLSAMYIDRPLKDVQAVQTLSRLNRPSGPTKRVFALDFVNDSSVLDGFARFFQGSNLVAAPTPDHIAELRTSLDAAGVYTEGEVHEVARLALAPDAGAEHTRQERIAGHVSVAVERFAGLVDSEQTSFRSDLGEFLRLYALLAQVVLAPDPSLEARAVYGRWLIESLPSAGPRTMVSLSGRVAVEYFRLAAASTGMAEIVDPDDTTSPGTVTLDTRSSAPSTDPSLRLSELLQRLNDRYGFGASPEDRASLDALIDAVLTDDAVVDAVRASVDARELVRDREVQKALRRRFRARPAGDVFAARFDDGDEDLRRELMEMVLDAVQRRVPASPTADDPDALSADDLARLAELSVLRNALEPRLRGFVRRVLENVHGERWFDEVLRCVPEAERRRLDGIEPVVVLRDRLYLSTLAAVIERNWGSAFGVVLESAPAQDRLSRAQWIALLEVLNAHREDAHAKVIRETDLTVVRAVVGQLHRVLDRVTV